jgi:hypothetical protein
LVYESWRFSFDRQVGDLYLGDVGQNAWEEIDFQPGDSSGGENYGWNILEGLVCYLTSNCDDSGMTAPVQVYSHGSGNCSVTGGFVYRGSSEPGLQGIYFYADYCSGKIWGLVNENDIWSSKDLLNTDFNISAFGEARQVALSGRPRWRRRLSAVELINNLPPWFQRETRAD